MTYTSTEPYSVWDFVYKKSGNNADEKKKVLVTNYVKGQNPDVSLPVVATGGIVPNVIGRDIVKNLDIIWYGNLKPITETETKQTTVTDPTTGVETVTTTVTTNVTGYTIDVQFCVGLGPGVRLRRILLDNTSIWTGISGPARATFSVVNNAIVKDVIFAGGNFDQAVDPYLQSVIPQQLSGYRGFAYLVLKAVDVSKLGSISVEVDRYPDPLGLGAKNKIGEDINPASAMAEMITSTWGGAGIDVARLGASFTTLGNLLYDEANGGSMIIRNEASANQIDDIMLGQVDATMWEDHATGKIEVTPFRKNFDRANLLRLFDKDITKINRAEKAGWSLVPTSVQLKYNDRSMNYAEIPVGARNFAVSGKVNKSPLSVSFPAVRTKDLAAKLLARIGATSGSPVQQVTLTTNRKAASCNPGDIILITVEKYKYISVPAIVIKRNTQPLKDNSVTLVCNIILYPNNNVLFAAPEDSFFTPVDPTPHAPTAVRIVSAPWAYRSKTSVNYGTGGSIRADYAWNLTVDQQQFFGKAYSAAQQYEVIRYHDVPSNTDIIVPSYNTPSNFIYPSFAKLVTAIGKYDNWDDSSDTEQIQLSNIGPGPAMTSALNAYNSGAQVSILIDDEYFVIYKHTSSSFVYNEVLRTALITGVRRGVADTVAQAHAANADVIVFVGFNLFTGRRAFPFATNVDFLATSISSPKNVPTESDIGDAFSLSFLTTDRANKPLRPHNTMIQGSRGTSSPTALVRASTPTISWNIRGRSIANSFTPEGDVPRQTSASQPGEVLGSLHVAYRVWIKDSANVDWDCGVTSNTADHASLVITVPAGAAVGVGSLWVDAEFDAGAGLKVSQFKDLMPITLS